MNKPEFFTEADNWFIFPFVRISKWRYITSDDQKGIDWCVEVGWLFFGWSVILGKKG